MIESLVGSLSAAIIASGFVFSAYVLSLRLVGSRRIWIRWAGTIAGVIWLATALFHFLSFLRLFNRSCAVVSVLVLSLAVWSCCGKAKELLRALAHDRTLMRRTGRLCLRSRHRVMAALVIAFALPGLFRALLLPPIGWDSLTYHAVKAGMWVQSGGVDSMNGPGPWAYHRNMLAGGEVFLAWGMLPFHSDVLTSVVEVSQFMALGLCVMVLARQLGLREPFATTVAGFVLALPTVRLLVGSGYVEIGLLLALVSGLVLGLGAEGPNANTLVLAGGALGVSAATKLPMVPLCGLLLLVFVARSVFQGPGSARAWSIAGAVAFCIALCPWLFLAFERTGYPFSPVPIAFAGVVLGRATPEVAWYLQLPGSLPNGLAGEVRVLLSVFGLPVVPNEALGALALVPLVGAPFGMTALIRKAPSYVLPVCVVIAACGVAYFSPSFAVVRHNWVVMYGDLLLALSLLNMARLALYGFSGVSLWATLLVVVGLGTLAILARSAWRLRGLTVRLGCLVLLGGIATAAFGTLRGTLRDDFWRDDFAIHARPTYWVTALPYVDQPGVVHRIALTSGPLQALDNWGAYPFMGRALQNELIYVPVSRDGNIHHFGDDARNRDLVETADYESWCKRLVDEGVTEVMSFSPSSLELRWMGQHPERFEPLAGEEGNWGLFRRR
ncbi:MAG: hypothetical protein H6Q33_1437 [Deltaproteobacteria bacterium]|nr:hypothetical protein [Deltaproteobacteria bacterium]